MWNLKYDTRDFPAGPVVKNPPSNAGDVGSIPGQGTKIPHALGSYIFSLCTATIESTCHNKDPVLCNQDPMQPNKQILTKKILVARKG